MKQLERLKQENGELRARLAEAEQALHNAAGEHVQLPEQFRSAPGAVARRELDAELWTALFDDTFDAMLFWDDHGAVVAANSAARSILALSPEELRARRWPELWAAEVDATSTWNRLMTEGRVAGRFRVRRSDGALRDVELRGSARAPGQPHWTVLRDVTDIRLAESRLRALIEGSTDVIMLLSAESRIQFTSPAVTTLLDYSAEELNGKSFDVLVHPDDRDKSSGQVRELLADAAQRRTTRLRLRRRDGSCVSVEAVGKNMLQDPAVQALVLDLRDIADRERGLEMQARLAAIVECSEDAIISKDRDDVITSWNAGATTLYQWTIDEMIGRSIEVLIPEELRASESAVTRRILGGEAVSPYDTRRLRKDGTAVEVALTVSPIRDAASTVVGVSKIGRDLSARRRAEAQLRNTEEQLRQAQKMEAVGVLAGGIAHDFNNMLSAIMSYAWLALEELDPEARLRGDLLEIMRVCDMAAKLTRQLLAFSRRQMLEPRVLALADVARGMEPMLRRLLGEDVELSLSSSDAGRIHADPSQLEQVLMNLVVNARDAMPKGGKLIIETCSVDLDDAYSAEHQGVVPGAYVVLAVTDTGVGMDAATRKHIFEPFFTTKGHTRGTGLGLSTVFGIVKQSGGHIWVYSEPGRGTTFKIYFPRTESALEAEQTPRVPSALRGSETILLVEDDEQVRAVARMILERQGYRVIAAQNGTEACAIAEQYAAPIHLLVTDVIMPGMSGRDVAERLKGARAEMRVLYMSGYAEDAIVHHGVVDPGIAFLPKPITPESLARKVRAVLDAVTVL